jgi:hypothetical protein
MTASQLLYYATIYSILIPIFIGFFNRSKLNNTLTLVWLTIIVNFGFALASFIPVKSWFGLNDNNFLFYISAAINIILKYFIFKNLLGSKNQNNVLVLMNVFLVAIPILIFTLGYDFRTLSFVTNLESLFTIILSLIFLLKLNKEYKGNSLRSEPMFWITSGYIISNVLSIIMMTFIDPIYQYSQELFTFIWDIFSPITNTVTYILYSIGLLKAKKTN